MERFIPLYAAMIFMLSSSAMASGTSNLEEKASSIRIVLPKVDKVLSAKKTIVKEKVKAEKSKQKIVSKNK